MPLSLAKRDGPLGLLWARLSLAPTVPLLACLMVLRRVSPRPTIGECKVVQLKPELRPEWVRAGYCGRMGSAEVVPPPPPDFRRVYHLTSAEFGISNIALGRMKVARISDLNDPFELMAVNFRQMKERVRISDFKTRHDSEYGLLCFSGNWTNTALWAHYGANQRGICLGFDLAQDLGQKVRYESVRTMQSFEQPEGELDVELQKKLLSTKSSDWEYEKEWRFFVRLADMLQEGTLHFYQFGDKLQLREVILGVDCNLSLDALERLTQAFYPHAVTFKARLAKQHFAIVPDDTVPRR
jgi:Protein of unknown function (DUF2971)